MAIQFLNTLNFNQNEAVSFRLDNQPNDPGTPLGGQLYYENTTAVVKFYDDVNSAWVTLADAANAGVSQLSIAAAGTNAGTINTSLVLSAATGAITLQPMQFGGLAKIGMVPDASATGDDAKFLQGDGTWSVPAGVYKWNLNTSPSGTPGTPEGIGNDDTVIVATNSSPVDISAISTTSGVSTFTVSHAAITTAASATSSTLTQGDTFDVVTVLANDTYGHITDVTTNTFTLPTSVTTVTAQNGVYNTGSATAPVIEVDYTANTNNVIASATSGTISKSHWLLAATDSGATAPTGSVIYGQVSDIPLNSFAVPTGNVTMGTSGGSLFNIVNLKDPIDAQDAATKAYADSLLSSALEFKGTFNPATGEIAPSTGTYLYQLTAGSFDSTLARVAVEVGDLYIASGSGDFYANTATPLTAGDQVFGQTAAAADASVEADWAVVQSDTDVSTYAAIGIGNTNVQASGSVASGYEGSNTTGDATGGSVNVDYSNGTANLSLRLGTASDPGILTVVQGSGIGIAYNASGGRATISSVGNPSGVRLSLGATSGNVTKETVTSTEQSWSIDTNTELGTTAINVTCQVTQASNGATVFPFVTRNGNDLIVSFTLLPSAPANDAYEVLLISVA